MTSFNSHLLDDNVQKFITDNLKSDIYKIITHKSPFDKVSSYELANQISSKNKCKNKIPLWFETPYIYYPEPISVEQSSSVQTAMYKASLLTHSKTIVDMTGGWGIDSFYFAQNCNKLIHCEIQEKLSLIAQHNFSILKQTNIECFLGNSSEYFNKNNSKVDAIYIDPSRRNSQKEKVFLLKECLPNVVELLPKLWYFTDTILIKTSPLFDIQQGIEELQHINEIHIVAVNNEVKELLFLLKNNHSKHNISIKCINLLENTTQKLEFSWNERKKYQITLSSPKKYLYEPNASIMKSGAWGIVCEKFLLQKLHNNSHLFTSDFLVNDFSGRIFEIQNYYSFKKNPFKNTQAHISVRNFPLSVDEIRKKLKIKDGGQNYLFFTTNLKNEKIIIQCNKINK